MYVCMYDVSKTFMKITSPLGTLWNISPPTCSTPREPKDLGTKTIVRDGNGQK